MSSPSSSGGASADGSGRASASLLAGSARRYGASPVVAGRRPTSPAGRRSQAWPVSLLRRKRTSSGETSASSSPSPSAATASSGSRTRPSSPTDRRGRLPAAPGRRARGCDGPRRAPPRRSWVTITIVTPNSRLTARNESSTVGRSLSRAPPSGSSASRGSSACSRAPPRSRRAAARRPRAGPACGSPARRDRPAGAARRRPGDRPRRRAVHRAGQPHVLAHREVGHQVPGRPLPHEPDPLGAVPRQGVDVEQSEVLSVDVHRRPRMRGRGRRAGSGSSTSRAARPDDRQELPAARCRGRRRRARPRRCRRSGRPCRRAGSGSARPGRPA